MTSLEPTSLHAAIRRLDASRRNEVRERWARDLPFDELLFDRWERAASLGFGDASSVYHSCHIYGDVTVGEHTWIGPFTLLDGSGGLEIGAWCSISAGVHIYSHDTVAWALTGGVTSAARSPTKIGDRTYIGALTVVDRGVTIGDHVVIGANSFVNHDIPPFSVAVGTPCRVVGTVVIGAGGDVRLEYDSCD
jgi:acetyltransferase-like isoleucine patch superfamily enzyme